MAMNTSMTQSKKFRNHKWMYGWLGLGALLLSGCVTIPPAIQGTTATPLQDLNLIRSAPKLLLVRKRALAVRLSTLKMNRIVPAWKLLAYRWIQVPDLS
ncbi:putative outer membrane protein [Yersinia pestis PY-72]|nr:putative outer membrane protein [Yersinia pestis A1122]EIS77036.1 putative outer membrane protein [Yersinia pestis PY-71]EIS79208.1 putative outer membrane protein [Yersinia pestis PY-72]EIS87523.1 putative outer membrane protein [Yersinia pestis PY-76]